MYTNVTPLLYISSQNTISSRDHCYWALSSWTLTALTPYCLGDGASPVGLRLHEHPRSRRAAWDAHTCPYRMPVPIHGGQTESQSPSTDCVQLSSGGSWELGCFICESQVLRLVLPFKTVSVTTTSKQYSYLLKVQVSQKPKQDRNDFHENKCFSDGSRIYF